MIDLTLDEFQEVVDKGWVCLACGKIHDWKPKKGEWNDKGYDRACECGAHKFHEFIELDLWFPLYQERLRIKEKPKPKELGFLSPIKKHKNGAVDDMSGEGEWHLEDLGDSLYLGIWHDDKGNQRFRHFTIKCENGKVQCRQTETYTVTSSSLLGDSMTRKEKASLKKAMGQRIQFWGTVR